MKNKVIEILKTTEVNHQNVLVETYINWCNKHALSVNHLQYMLTSKALCNWYIKEYTRQEKLFVIEANRFLGKVKQSQINDLYNIFTGKIKNYPKPIMFELCIKSQSDISLLCKEELTNTSIY